MLLSYYKRPLVLMLLLLCGAIVALKDNFLKPADVPPFNMPRYSALVEGRVAEYPVSQGGKARFEIDQVSIYHKPIKSSLMVYAKDVRNFSYGDRIGFLADIYEPAENYVPGGLNWSAYLFRRGISAEARAVSTIDIVSEAPAYIKFASSFRDRILSSFKKNLPENEAAVLSGIVIGEKRSVDEKLKDSFQKSGAMHLLVASGSNVGFVVVVVYAICAWFGLRRRFSGFFALFAAGIYVVACGLDMPLVRAYAMFAACLFAFMCRRESGGFHSLVLAAFVILLCSPRSLFDTGFQLSFLAAYGLVAGTSIWNERIKKLCDRLFTPKRKKKPGKGAAIAYSISSLLFVSLFAQVFLYPLMAAYFHQISLVSLVSNLFLVPMSGVLMFCGFLLAIMPSLGIITSAIAFCTSLCLKIFILLINIFAAFPLASISFAEPSWLVICGFYVLAWTFIHWPLLYFAKYLLPPMGILLMLAQPVMQSVGTIKTKQQAHLFGNKEVSTVIIALRKGIFLVNPGQNGKKLADAIYAQGRYSINAVLFTSIDEKTFQGLPDLAQKLKIRNIYLPYGPMNDDMYRALSAARHSGANIQQVWPEEKEGDVHLMWPEQVYGYAGRGEPYDWKVYDVKITNNGRCASIRKDGRWSTPECRGFEDKSVIVIDID